MFPAQGWYAWVKAGQEADGGALGGGGGGVGLRGEAARRSGAASEVAVWACGVAAAARAAATAPGLRLLVLGALGGVAGVLEARESGVWCMRFSAEQRERMLTPFGVLRRACSAAAGACVSRSTLAPLLRARCTLGCRVDADGAVSANPETTAARQEHEDALDDD